MGIPAAGSARESSCLELSHVISLVVLCTLAEQAKGFKMNCFMLPLPPSLPASKRQTLALKPLKLHQRVRFPEKLKGVGCFCALMVKRRWGDGCLYPGGALKVVSYVYILAGEE